MDRSTQSTPAPRDTWPWHLAALVGYLLLGVLATWPLALHALTAVPGFDSPITRAGMADQDQGLWAAWWVRTALFERHTSPFQTDLLYWPYYRQGLSLLLYDMQILRTVIALPVQWLLGLAAAYNVGVFASFALGGYGTFLLARERGLSRPAAALAGLIFVAGPYHLMQLLWETSLVVVEALPFALLWSWRALRDGGRGAILLAALCIVWANFSSWYYGAYALIALALLAAGLAWRRRRAGWPAIRPVAGRFLMVGAIYGLLYSPILLPVLGQVATAPSGSGLFINIATIRGASMQWYKLFFNDRDPVVQPAQWHGTGFIGYTAALLALLACVGAWRRAWPWLAVFAVFLNLAMGPDLHALTIGPGGQVVGAPVIFPNGDPVPLPYAFLMRLPGMGLVRAPAHASVMILLCVAILAGLGLDALVAWAPRWRRRRQAALLVGLAVLAGALALGEYLTVPLPLYTVQWAPVFQTLGQDPAQYGILELPITLHASSDHHRMFNQIAHGKGIAGAYLPRPVPDPYRQADSPLARFTQPYTTTDVLAQDDTAATNALLQLFDFRYVAIYHARKDYRVGDSPWDWPLGTAPLPGGDATVTVYPAPPADLDKLYLYLGGNWSLPERTPDGAQRWLGNDPGYVIAWSPGGAGRLSLDLAAAPAAGPQTVAIALESRSLLAATLPADGAPRRIVTPPLSLARGWYRFRVTDLSASAAPGVPPALALHRAAWAGP